MNKNILLMLLVLGGLHPAWGQDTTVYTSDIVHFWEAYDSARTTPDSLRQLHFIQTLYIDQGTPGLTAFMSARDYSAENWVHLIRSYPKFWASIRPHTLSVLTKVPQMEASVQRFRKLYPGLRDAKMYFTVGGLRSGGTTSANMVLIGSEIATADSSVDVSEFPDDLRTWLGGVFKHMNIGYVVPLNVHEYVHTQQKGLGQATDLLGNCLLEGGADFIAQLVTELPLESQYIVYGRAHEAEVKDAFQKVMFEPYDGRWLYDGGRTKTMADLGYFMGFAICTAYYRQAADKQQAVADIINLDVADSNALLRFVTRSGYFGGSIDRSALKLAFETRQPRVIRFGPIAAGDTTVDPGIAELTIAFSEPMEPKGHAFIQGQKGIVPDLSDFHFSDDNKLLTIKLHLKPTTAYDFILSGFGFRSAKDFPLKEYPVNFKTRAL